MAGNLTSAKFARIYLDLPPEAQQILVNEHLMKLLDVIPEGHAAEVLAASSKVQSDFRSKPTLDLKRKQNEFRSLLQALNMDTKISVIKERSRQAELLTEFVDSLTSWLKDIWSVTFEYNVEYLQAHACLLYVAEVISRVNTVPNVGACRCLLLNVPVDITLKSLEGETVKVWAVKGLPNIDRILLWVWRDLFVSFLSQTNRHGKKHIPEMLDDIQSVMGWPALERLLSGGKKSVFRSDGCHDDDEEEEEDSDYIYDDSEDDDDDDFYRCTCPFHAKHWLEQIDGLQIDLRKFIEKSLCATFEISPSLRLYNTLLHISDTENMADIQKWLLTSLAENATLTAETLTAALDIYSAEGRFSEILLLLDSHSYLLRPRDAPSLYCAVKALSFSPSIFWQSRGLEIIERELHDSIAAIHSSIRSAFSQIESPKNKSEFVEILKLRVGTQTRMDRIQAWVEATLTATSGPNPLAFAAMMMGFPMGMGTGGVEDGEDPELTAYLDMAPNDPDLEELREEFRPNLKERLEEWYELSTDVTGGTAVATKVYTKTIELMPFLRAKDIVDEMLSRLSERPGRGHLCDAVEFLSKFCQIQRKIMSNRRGKEKSTANGTSGAPPPGFGVSTSGFPFSFSPSGNPFAQQHYGSGMEDVG